MGHNSRTVERYSREFLELTSVDVIIAGAGPAGLTTARLLAKEGKKVLLLEKKLAPGGGMWGGGMTFPIVVVQPASRHLLEDVGVKPEQISTLVKSSRGNSMSGNPVQLSDEELTEILEGLL